MRHGLDGGMVDWWIGGLVERPWPSPPSGAERGNKMMIFEDDNHNKMMVLDVDQTASPLVSLFW